MNIVKYPSKIKIIFLLIVSAGSLPKYPRELILFKTSVIFIKVKF